MARPVRVHAPEVLYHITDRGNNGRTIFQDDQDRCRLLGYFKEAVDKFRVRIHAFCLMPNHYHLEAETPRENISKTMQWIKTTYAFYFNRRYKNYGHLFQGRFKSILVEKESHLVELSRYIHLNPVRGGLVTKPDDYAWSSYMDYVGTRKRREWLETDWILEHLETYGLTGHRGYRDFVEEGLRCESPDPMKNAISGIALGSESFVAWVKEKFQECGEGAIPTPDMKRLNAIAVETVIATVAEVYGVSANSIRQSGHHRNIPRQVAVFLAHKYSNESNETLGRVFGGIHGTNMCPISKQVTKMIERDHALAEAVRRMEENLLSDV